MELLLAAHAAPVVPTGATRCRDEGIVKLPSLAFSTSGNVDREIVGVRESTAIIHVIATWLAETKPDNHVVHRSGEVGRIRKGQSFVADRLRQACGCETSLQPKVSQKMTLTTDGLRIPQAPLSIAKGASLKNLLGKEAIECLASNISLVDPQFDGESFRATAMNGIEPLGIMDRGPHIARALRHFLPQRFDQAIQILMATLTRPLDRTEGNGLAVFFYHPHASFVSEFGLNPIDNGGDDPFDVSMDAQYELTKRFTAEFSIRPFLTQYQERTLARIKRWITDVDPHVRRLCSEGTRPRLPWGRRIPALIAQPAHTLPILEALKDDTSRYVRRSVANHLGDIAKDHPEVAFSTCERWLRDASGDVKWLLRHALRHPAKQGNKTATRLRLAAK